MNALPLNVGDFFELITTNKNVSLAHCFVSNSITLKKAL